MKRHKLDGTYFFFIGLIALLALGCSTDVLHQIPEDRATQIVAVLQQHGIPATKSFDNEESNLWRVSVPRGAAARAFTLLAEYKLPRKEDRRFQDVFGQRKLVVTPTEESALYLEALQGELAHTLEAIDGVIEARVHLVPMRRDLTGRALITPKASVMLEYLATEQGLAPIQNVEIQKLIANAVEELAPESVAVVQKSASIAAPSRAQASDFNLVSIGPLVVEESTLPAFKTLIGAAVLAIGGLGGAAFWQSRMVAELRDELKVARTGLAAIEPGTEARSLPSA